MHHSDGIGRWGKIPIGECFAHSDEVDCPFGRICLIQTDGLLHSDGSTDGAIFPLGKVSPIRTTLTVHSDGSVQFGRLSNSLRTGVSPRKCCFMQLSPSAACVFLIRTGHTHSDEKHYMMRTISRS